jgi:predicted DNA-binding transcriptional regulator AlpA
MIRSFVSEGTNMTNTTETCDELVPDPEVCREFSISAMTLWRWDRDAALKFPPPVRIRKRKYRRRHEIEAFKRRMLAEAVTHRAA